MAFDGELPAAGGEVQWRPTLYQGPGVVPDSFYKGRGLNEPGERRLAMIDALLREHAERPEAFNQADPTRCCYAVARRVGLYGASPSMNMGLEIDDIVDVFGWEPELGTAFDAAVRLQAVHERLAGVPAAALVASPRTRRPSFADGFLEGCRRFLGGR